jgi:exopolyphosphatase/guanosine-5'-triphosphate,3'-diphosphate pyrophosphatase
MYAAVDIGTNTTRLIIARDVGGSLEIVERHQRITRLGEGMGDGNRRLLPGAVRRTVDALASFLDIWRKMGVRSYRAVATAAARESENSGDFIAAAREAGIIVELITPMEEARLAVRGIQGAVPLDDGIGVIMDVGGGSTEFVLTADGAVSDIISTDLGVVRLREQFITSYPPDHQSLIDLKNWLDNTVSLVYNQFNIPGGTPGALHGILEDTYVRLVGTAGTATSLAAMDMKSQKYDPHKIDGYAVSGDAIGSFISQVSTLNQEDILARYPILMEGREDVILPGMMIIASVMERFNAGSLIVSDRGLLEGIVEHLIDQSHAR